MLLEAFRHGNERPDEHSCVPAILTAIQIFQRSVEIRFFNELLCAMKSGLVTLHTLGRRHIFPNTDVTVAGGWLGGLDADRDNGLAATGEIEGVGQNLLKFLFFRD